MEKSQLKIDLPSHIKEVGNSHWGSFHLLFKMYTFRVILIKYLPSYSLTVFLPRYSPFVAT